MRRLFTMTACIVVIIAAFGCGNDKKGDKGTLRGRGGQVGVHGAKPDATRPDTAATKPGASKTDAGKSTPATTADLKDAVDILKNCQNPLEDVLAIGPKEVELTKGLSDAVDGSDNEYQLSNVEVYYKGPGEINANQIDVKIDGYANESSPTRTKDARDLIEVACHNSAKLKGAAPSGKAGTVAAAIPAAKFGAVTNFINRFSTKDGSFSFRLETKTEVNGKTETKDAKFIEVTNGNVEREDELDAALADIGLTSKITKDEEGTVRVRMAGTIGTLHADILPGDYSIIAVYKKVSTAK